MSEERKGILTPEQEQQLDDLLDLNGVYEMLDGPAIRLADNQGIELLKQKLPEEYLPILYEIVDELFKALPTKK